MSRKVSRQEEIKRKMQEQILGKQQKNARAELMGNPNVKVNEKVEPDVKVQPEVKKEIKVEDEFTIAIKPLELRLAHPEQTFGRKADRTSMLGLHFEPEVFKALKDDQAEKGRGWQSHLVNELVKQYYKEKGSL